MPEERNWVVKKLVRSCWPGLTLTIALIAALAFSAGSIMTARGQGDGTFYACESQNGNLRNISTRAPDCSRRETLVSWTGNGQPGPVGPVGPAGAQGPQGVAGPQGEIGLQGPQGETGPQGATGADGPQGPTGDTGAQGATGAPGAQGATGTTGPQGAPGATGTQGPAGVSGYERVVTAYTDQTPIAGTLRQYRADCPSEKKVVGGGGHVFGTAQGWLMRSSSADGDNVWIVTFTNPETTTVPSTINITAICVTIGS
jgi:hypothetical protein